MLNRIKSPARRADAGRMHSALPRFNPHRPPPTSNKDRQRQFRQRNPGYYGRLHRKRNAKIEALAAARAAEAAGLQTIVMAKPQLCLPAPDLVSQQIFADLHRLKAEREKVAA